MASAETKVGEIDKEYVVRCREYIKNSPRISEYEKELFEEKDVEKIEHLDNASIVDLAHYYRLREILKEFNGESIDEEECWQMTLRVKRGSGRTENPGANTKDHLYLQGLLNVKEYLRKGNEIEDLYYGKLACNEVEMAKKDFELVKPKYLPNYNMKKIKAVL